jgi:hypothetical protein
MSDSCPSKARRDTWKEGVSISTAVGNRILVDNIILVDSTILVDIRILVDNTILIDELKFFFIFDFS